MRLYLTLPGVIAMMAALAAGGACGDGPSAGGVDAAMPPDGHAQSTTTVFLNFDGATLTKGIPDDPATNLSMYIRPGGAAVPPWHDGRPDRAASVAAIVAGVRAVLAPYDVDVVTSRPAAPPYEMIMFGGDARALFGAGPIDMLGGGDCMDGPDISFVTESVTDDEVAASLAVGAVAQARFVPLTIARGDCLCFRGDECLPYTGELCAIGGVGTPARPDLAGCDGRRPAPPPTIDVHAYFVDRFGAR